MTSFQMPDGTLVRTEKASQRWETVSRNTLLPHTWLYRSRKGRYYIEYERAWPGGKSTAEWVSNEEAARWLLKNEHELPDELKPLVEEVTE